jgi:hypothetical protein
MDWFERLTGFPERGWEETRAKLEVDGEVLRSCVSGAKWGVGALELVSLAELRGRAATAKGPIGRLRVSEIAGDAGELHGRGENARGLFQVASQFNLLEMTGPGISPEVGVTGYAHDHTQGPACAIAAGAATIYRNYFAPVAGATGQRADRQIDTLADLGVALAAGTGLPITRLWTMRNGYCLPSEEGLAAIRKHLIRLGPEAFDRLRGLLRIGVHWDVEVTASRSTQPHTVSQAFCSALPLGYCGKLPTGAWAPFASLVLEAAYEATLLTAALNARRGASNVVFLTRLGGGVFGNPSSWIDAAIDRALSLASDLPLDVRLVTLGG